MGALAMARKNLLQGLMDETQSTEPERQNKTGAPARVDPSKPRYSGGAIGAVSQSIQSLKSRSVTEIDTNEIDAGGLEDRLSYENDEDFAALVESIRSHGQQVPILVRPHPEAEGRYQIVYGRRRVMALRHLGLAAKALVRALDDKALVMAQGLENSARRDLSYVEKCNFAHQMRQAGYERPAICEALSVDKTQISRMLQVIDRVGVPLVEHVGSAPGIGRDRWAKLADRVSNMPESKLSELLGVDLSGVNGDARFDAIFNKAAPTANKPQTSAGQPLVSKAGGPLGLVTHSPRSTVLTFQKDQAGDFADWLVGQLSDLHAQWEDKKKP